MSLKPKQVAMLDELKNNYHNISRACNKVGVSRTTHHAWVNDNEHYKKESDDIQDALLDRAEEILMNRLDESDTALIFFLKTKGKSRGYVEKQEIAVSGDGLVNKIEIEVIKKK